MKNLTKLKKYSLKVNEMDVLNGGAINTTYNAANGTKCNDTVEKRGTNLFDDGGVITC